MSLIIGLLWRDLINALVALFPNLPGVVGNLISTLFVTAVFGVVIVQVNHRIQRQQKAIDDEKKGLDEEKLAAGKKVEFRKK